MLLRRLLKADTHIDLDLDLKPRSEALQAHSTHTILVSETATWIHSQLSFLVHLVVVAVA
jgi:hypothetical protein